MILSRCRYRPVTVFGPPLLNVTLFLKGYIPLPSVKDRDTIVTCVTERYMCYRTLPNVTERYMRYKRYRTLQALPNVTYGIYEFSRI
jgi:hypothetical protein